MKQSESNQQGQPVACQAPRRSVRERIDRLLAWALEDQADKGLGGPPNNWRSVRVRDKSSSWTKHGRETSKTHSLLFDNDCFELVLGTTYVEGETTESVNNLIIRADVFRRLALWYIWRWVWGEWFGLRRWLFYKWLHRKVEGYKRRQKGA